MCVIITLGPNRKKLMGKSNEKKWRGKYVHDKEAHSNKIKGTPSSATAG